MLLLTIFKEGAGNIFFWVADVVKSYKNIHCTSKFCKLSKPMGSGW
jgi:hypothetical protein